MARYILIVLCTLGLIACGGDVPKKKTSSLYRAGEILVKFKTGVVDAQRENLHRVFGATAVRKTGHNRFERVKLPEGISVEEAVKAYNKNPEIEYAEPNYIVRAAVLPDDIKFGEQWGLHNIGQKVNDSVGSIDADIHAQEAWDITHGSSSVIVAVIDSGIDRNHPDISVNLTAGYDFVDNDSDPDDLNGHGTHLAGIIGAVGNNAAGITGVNWAVKIMPLKVLDRDGEGDIAAIIDAIDYAADHKVKIVNMSFSSTEFSDSLYDSMASYPQILFVAAAGNGGDDGFGDNNDFLLTLSTPASYDLHNVLSVAATDQDDALTEFSNYGPVTVDVAAPGSNILGTIPSFIAGVTYTGIYRLVYLSFGFEGINGVSSRNAVMQRVLDFHSITKNDKILLVDDDAINTYETYYKQSLEDSRIPIIPYLFSPCQQRWA